MAEELPNLSKDQLQDHAISMKDSANNLFRLLNNLLEWSQMQDGSIPFKPELVRLRIIVDESIEMIIQPAKAKAIEMVIDITDDIEVFADVNMLQTVIRNLIFNALKFTRRGGVITVIAKINAEKNVEVSIKDTGIGMSQSMVDNLFRSDFKSNRNGTEGEPSTGLGLLLSKDFVEKNGGEIWVESKVENGSTFHFSIPYHT